MLPLSHLDVFRELGPDSIVFDILVGLLELIIHLLVWIGEIA